VAGVASSQEWQKVPLAAMHPDGDFYLNFCALNARGPKDAILMDKLPNCRVGKMLQYTVLGSCGRPKNLFESTFGMMKVHL